MVLLGYVFVTLPCSLSRQISESSPRSGVIALLRMPNRTVQWAVSAVWSTSEIGFIHRISGVSNAAESVIPHRIVAVGKITGQCSISEIRNCSAIQKVFNAVPEFTKRDWKGFVSVSSPIASCSKARGSTIGATRRRICHA